MPPVVDIVRTDGAVPLAESRTLSGLKDAVGPLGDTTAVRLTVPTKPLMLFAVTVDVLDDPWSILSEEGFDKTVKPSTSKLPRMVIT